MSSSGVYRPVKALYGFDRQENQVLTMSNKANGERKIPNSDGLNHHVINNIDVIKHVNTDVTSERNSNVIYGVDDVPPWYLCILLGFQHYLTAFGSTITVPLVLAPALCIDQDMVGLSEIISTIFFMSGIATLLQTTIGVRLPIIQGATFAFLTPTFSILALPRWECEYTKARETDPQLVNSTLPAPGSDAHREMWQSRIREIQGAIMVSSLFEVLIGFSGLIGFLLRFIGPLAITPTIALIGFGLFKEAADKASAQWYIAFMTMFLIALFSQYLRNIKIPCLVAERGKGCTTTRMPIFSLFPVLLAMIVSWIVCVILTASGAFPKVDGQWGYKARTDIKTAVLYESDWFRFPYPGQWGTPTVSTAAVFGMLAGVLSSMIESIGDYYACARLSGAPPPPVHAVNRGIGVEGICCVLAGAMGSGNGTTSYSENVGAIGITKVGSRRVVQVGGAIMIVLGCLGKFGALFVTIPDPVVGGMFMVMFGMITAVGISNLQYVDLNSSRNIFILGVSMFFGLSFPKWIAGNKAINTGSDVADQIISVLLGTSMFVGGMTGFILDNTIPGTDEERGITKWRQHGGDVGSDQSALRTYDIPFIQKYLDRVEFFRYLPFCPRFSMKCGKQIDTEEIEIPVANESQRL
ncbi:solute carrier family 23 member 1-like isoform X1 [Dreissena polymorpha]|uniref:solute carrier family 23 member 1-like isoform X1 n=2 Tax=Dreissena polymorpha TaxID=45954 RepID=UPI0022645245|nr:solute carrier family 23 member 1-like isoform X1 [Dreissena polymorpha]XP_052247370.1 solute carrier family 23 member 1-like isoform X1 [Dreissena polymorpha]XP_052247372.1 solute carrier family 23 member 1-like isoform X1 [Dreissena polymorpha]XP_052247373.1 solute carrier family 23 member 1-like isoform X1 [Dreissena polymorpha]